MPMTGFFCQDEYLAKTVKLTDEEVGRLFRALMTYHATGAVADLDGRESIAFDFIKEDIDKAEEAYTKKCRQASENRRKGLNPDQVENDGGQRPSTSVNGSHHNNINKNICNVKNKDSSEPAKRFTPPTVEEVRAYCQERRNQVDPERFVDFYSSKGWRVGNQPMKDWKAAVRTWEKRDGLPIKKMPAADFPQRDYSDADSMILNELAAEMDAFRKAGAG